ncbi:PAS domain S-box protein [bacterium]|nr:PAS domain S-box protein [bacterium]
MFQGKIGPKAITGIFGDKNNDPVLVHTMSEEYYCDRLLECNNAARLLLDIPTDPAGFDIFRLKVKPRENKNLNELKETLDREDSVTFKAMVLLPHGPKPICSFQTHRVQSKGNFVYITMLHDLTALFEINDQLAQSAVFYQEVMENINDAIFRINRDGRFSFISQTGVKRSGYDEATYSEYHFLDIVDPEYHQAARSFFDRAFSGEPVQPVILKYKNAEGRSLFVEVSAQPLYQNGTIESIQCVSRDVTTRMETERQLLESERKFKILTEHSLLAMAIVGQEKIIYINDEASLLLGYSKEELLSHSTAELLDIFVHNNRDELWDQYQRKLRNDPVVVNHYSFPVRKKGGSIIWVENYSRAISYEGKNAILVMLRDITLQQRIEETLRESEQKYRLLFDSAPVGICRVRLDGTIIHVNPAMARLLGYRDGPEMLLALENNLKNAFVQTKEKFPLTEDDLDNITTFSSEHLFRHKDGRAVMCNVNGRIIRDQGREKPDHYFEAFFEDITERKNAEQALKEGEEKYRTLIENSNDIIFNLDPEGRFTYISPQVELLGKTPEEILSMTIFDLVLPEEQEHILHDLCEIMYQERGIPSQFRIYDQAGKIHWFENCGRVVKDDQGHVKGFTGILREITARKEAEEALSESQLTNQALVNSIPDLMFRVSSEGIFLDYYASQVEMLAMAPEQFLGKSAREVLSPELAEMTLANIEKSRASDGEMQVYEYSIEVPLHSGHQRYYEARMLAINPKEFLIIIRDITDRKRAEMELRDSLREKEILLKEIHHRVKNNLQIISSLLHLQSRRVQDQELLEKFAECQARIQSIALIHTKLYQSSNFSSLDFGEYIRSLMSYILRMFGSRCENIQLINQIKQFSMNIDLAIPCGLIINELVSNAIKHAFVGLDRGTITLDLTKTMDNTVTLIVQDDGIGLPDAINLEHGDSLGLVLINSLVEQIEGHLEVGHEGGTCFKITFKT